MLLLNQFLRELPEIVEQCPSTGAALGSPDDGWVWVLAGHWNTGVSMWIYGVLPSGCCCQTYVKRTDFAQEKVLGCGQSKVMSFLLALLLSILQQRCCVWLDWATSYLINQGWLTPKTALWAPEVCYTRVVQKLAVSPSGSISDSL